MVHKEDLLEMFITYDLEDLYGDFSDDGDGKLELTEKGNEVATRLIKLVEQEIEKAREEGRKNIFTKEELRVIRWAFRNMEEQINTVWDEETYNQIEKKLE